MGTLIIDLANSSYIGKVRGAQAKKRMLAKEKKKEKNFISANSRARG